MATQLKDPYHVVWTHAHSGDTMVGLTVPREEAEELAQMLERSEWCIDVKIRKGRGVE